MSGDEPQCAPKLYSDDVADRPVDDDTPISLQLDRDQFSKFFEEDRTVDWIKLGGYQRVALQLPDYFLNYAAELAQKLEKKTGSKIYILADTSYRSCCVDTISAEHSVCDALVHYGEACLSATNYKIPVLYIFGQFAVDVHALAELFHASFGQVADSERPKLVVLIYDAVYAHKAEEIADQLGRRLDVVILNCKTPVPNEAEQDCQLGRIVPKDLSDTSSWLFFIGNKNSALLPVWLLTFPQFQHVWSCDPTEMKLETQSPASHRQLRRRLYLIERLKDAHTVGLVVSTLATTDAPCAIQRVRDLCKVAGKKLYVFAIGKLNEAKLSNFAGEIDAFILLSCPFGVILDGSDFLKPILSMFEAEIALNPASDEWFAAAGWTAEFGRLLNGGLDLHSTTLFMIAAPIGQADSREQETDVSLISGNLRRVTLNGPEQNTSEATNQQVTLYSAGDYFQNRTWRGLDDACDEQAEEQPAQIRQGLSGLAMGYQSEPSEKRKHT